jgi:oligopeptide transport system substrate-binding protein
MNIKNFFSQLLYVAALCCIMGCSKSEKPAVRNVNLYLQAEVFSLDPRVGGDRRAQFVIRQLFEGLTRIGKAGLPELGVAQSYTVSEDGTVYTFHLRPTKWSNGMNVTADDFAWSWKSVLNSSFPTPFSYAFFLIKNAKKAHGKECSIDEVGVRVVDPLTLEITLEHPAPYFFEFLANPLFSPLCRAVCEKNADWAATCHPNYVSNGPFLLKERVMRSHTVIEKNPFYWNQEGAKSDRITFAIVEHPQTAFNMFSSGALDWHGDPCGNMSLEMVSELQKQGSLITKQTGGSAWLVSNVKTAHLASPKIRKAIAWAMNRQEICDSLLQGGETPSYSILPDSLTLLKKPTFEDNNPQMANALFEEGLKELGLTRETFPKIVLTHWADPSVQLLAQTEQQLLQQRLGITVELSSLDWNTLQKKFTSGDFQLMQYFWFTWYQDPIYNLGFLKFTNNGINGTSWHSDEYVRLLDLADSSNDSLQRNEYLRQAETLLMEQMPVIPLCYTTYKYVKAPNLVGEILSQTGHMELKQLEKTE